MDDLKLVFAANLIRLRQEAGLTQAGLAEKINYSGKSVSKWERGEAIPDAYVLKALSDLFHVSIDDLLTEHDKWNKAGTDLSRKVSYSQMFVILCSVAGIITLCLLEFIIVWAIVDKFHWLVLFAALPLSLTDLLIMNSVWYKGKNNMYIVMALLLSVIIFFYLLALQQYRFNFWQLLLVIVPAELIVFFAFQIRSGRIFHKRSKDQDLSDS